MKKIILSATLLGSFYFANAQVGIGTPTPVSSTMLDITAADKGVLIPRVNLTALNVFAPVTGTEQNGLLVFATGENNDKSASDVKSGFYYWNVDKWERIVNQTQLDQVISNQADIAKIKALLEAAYGSNNLGDTATTNPWGGMVYTPADGSTPAKIEYVQFVNGAYTKSDATAGLISLIQGNETKTTIVTIKNVQYYLSETFNKSSELAAATTDEAKYLVLFPTSGDATTGFFKIDVVGGVVNNFNDIINSTTRIEGTTQTIQQYFQSLGADSNTVYFNNTNTAITVGGESVPSYSFYIKNSNGDAVLISLAELVSTLETKTVITKEDTTNTVSATSTIIYKYFNEDSTFTNGSVPTDPQQTIDLAADITSILNNNTTIKDIIKSLVANGANVGYTTTAIDAGTPTGQLEIPANSFYTVDATTGIKTLIDLASLVKNLETDTSITKNVTGSVAAGDIKIDYKYFNEALPDTTGAHQQIIDIHADLKTLIEGNTEIKNAISNILNAGGNVYHGDHDNDPNTPNVFYTINNAGTKTKIEMSDIVVDATTINNNSSVEHINNVTKIKQNLGDNFETTTIVKTGDVWTDGKAVYKGIFDAFIKNGTANVVKTAADSDYSEISISGTVGQIISISVLDADGNKLTSSVTDVVTATTGVKFRIGTGNMYNVIYPGTGATAIKVLIEYSAGAVVTP